MSVLRAPQMLVVHSMHTLTSSLPDALKYCLVLVMHSMHTLTSSLPDALKYCLVDAPLALPFSNAWLESLVVQWHSMHIVGPSLSMPISRSLNPMHTLVVHAAHGILLHSPCQKHTLGSSPCKLQGCDMLHAYCGGCDVSHAYLGILIDARLVLDILGSVGIAQRADGLVVVVVCRADIGNHHRLCVTAQGILHSAAGLSVMLSAVLVLAKQAKRDSNRRRA